MPDNGKLRPAVFLDRDGTICEEMGYLNHASRFRMFPFAAEAVRRLNEAGLVVAVVTNQSGVGRGYFPESLVKTVHERMLAEIKAGGARLDAIYYCPHALAENCQCRKPRTGMIERAKQEHGIDVPRSFFVGDRHGDMELAHRAGGRSILVRTGYGAGEMEWRAASWTVQPDFVADDLAGAVDWILRQEK